MTLESLSTSLESILRYDKTRLNTVGRLFQNILIYVVLVFLFGSLLEDIFPVLNESRPLYLIILEIVGQLLLISFIIFYLQKVIDYIPYVGGNNYESDDISLRYCEQLIIFVIITATQKNLISKIKYVYERLNHNQKPKLSNKEKQEKDDAQKIKYILKEQPPSKVSDEQNSSQDPKMEEPSVINQRINIYNQDDKLKYVPKSSYSKPIKPLLTSNDFLKDSMVMEYVDLVKKSNDKIDTNYNQSKIIDSYRQTEQDFSTFNNPSLSDNNSFGTSISKIPNFNQV